jgi:Ca2+-binding EF-hand superfamily protein
MLKLTFNLKVDRAELGAILKEFDPNIESSLIPASEFLRYFLRLGIDVRDKARAEQRQKQLELNAQMEQEQAKKLAEASAKMNLEVDYNFSESAEESAKEKLLVASTKYDRYATGAVALDGFECDSLDPGAFKDLIRRVFNLVLTSGELGYVVQKYDTKNTGRVTCKAFLTDFLRMGNEARYKAHVEQLERQRMLNQQAEEEHHKKIIAVQNSESIKISERYSDKHLQSALAKLTEASLNYDKVRGVSLISFEPATLTPLEFKKALKRTFNLKLSPQEMGAAVDYFDKDGSKQVNTMVFCISTNYSNLLRFLDVSIRASFEVILPYLRGNVFCSTGALSNLPEHVHHPGRQQTRGNSPPAIETATRRLGETSTGAAEESAGPVEQDSVQRKF